MLPDVQVPVAILLVATSFFIGHYTQKLHEAEFVAAAPQVSNEMQAQIEWGCCSDDDMLLCVATSFTTTNCWLLHLQISELESEKHLHRRDLRTNALHGASKQMGGPAINPLNTAQLEHFLLESSGIMKVQLCCKLLLLVVHAKPPCVSGGPRTWPCSHHACMQP